MHIEHPMINEICLRFKKISDVNFTLNSPRGPCISSSVNVEPTVVTKLFSDCPSSIWEHVSIVPSRLLTSITKGREYAVTCNFPNFYPGHMVFQPCLFPYCFKDQVIDTCMGLLT